MSGRTTDRVPWLATVRRRTFDVGSGQPRGTLPAMPHDPRPARASVAALAHAVSPEGIRRPFRRTLRVRDPLSRVVCVTERSDAHRRFDGLDGFGRLLCGC